MSDPGGKFICFARGLIFEGNVLTYDPSTNGAEWIPVHSTASDLSWVEEMSALALCNMVPHVPDEGAERLDRFGECRDKNERDGVKEESSAEAPHEEEAEEQTMDEDDREEEGHKEEDENANDEDGDEERVSHSSSGSMQKSPCSIHRYSDRCHCCLHSWTEQCESGNGEDGSFGEISVSENSEGEGGGEMGHLQALQSFLLCAQEFLCELHEVVGQTVPSETTSTTGNLPPADSQNAVVIHATEDELRSRPPRKCPLEDRGQKIKSFVQDSI